MKLKEKMKYFIPLLITVIASVIVLFIFLNLVCALTGTLIIIFIVFLSLISYQRYMKLFMASFHENVSTEKDLKEKFERFKKSISNISEAIEVLTRCNPDIVSEMKHLG
ncbi:MAG: hypothetical protein GY795_36120 [Desulfobacterales bacterium]|nr:hypothetical protein [Desulfobacterales bacterium]